MQGEGQRRVVDGGKENEMCDDLGTSVKSELLQNNGKIQRQQLYESYLLFFKRIRHHTAIRQPSDQALTHVT